MYQLLAEAEGISKEEEDEDVEALGLLSLRVYSGIGQENAEKVKNAKERSNFIRS